MANAASMIDQCFRHQHPEVYDRPGIDVPDEAWITRADESLPRDANAEGYVPLEHEAIAWA